MLESPAVLALFEACLYMLILSSSIVTIDLGTADCAIAPWDSGGRGEAFCGDREFGGDIIGAFICGLWAGDRGGGWTLALLDGDGASSSARSCNSAYWEEIFKYSTFTLLNQSQQVIYYWKSFNYYFYFIYK